MEKNNNYPFVLFTFKSTAQGCGFDFCSSAIHDYFGVAASDVMANPDYFFNILPDPEKSRLQRGFLETSPQDSTAQPINIEFSHQRINNEKHRYLLQAQYSANHDGSCWSGAIFSVDASYQKLEAAIKSANYFLFLQDQLPDLFYYKDTHSRFLGGNKAWRDFHGFNHNEDWQGKTDMDSPRLGADEGKKIFMEEQAMLRSGIPLRNRERLKNADGTDKYQDSIKVPIFDNRKKLLGLVGLTRDVTDQANTEFALANAKTAAEQAGIAKSSFLAVMSHEIRTPMNGVIGCASLLGETELNEEQQQLVRTIQSCGEGLLVIINDILDYSKIEAGQIILDIHHFHLRELIEDTLELFSKSAADKGLELNYFIEPDVYLNLEGDSSRIRQIMINLIGNAIKFTEQGEVIITISLTEKNSDESSCKLLFSVRDTGIGIPEVHQNNLFQVFTQADTSITRKYGGTGLGLAISKKIVQQMGGDIWFTSKPKVGTQFFFTTQVIYDEKEYKHQSLDTSHFRDLHALIVDDNATNRKILAATLMQWGMRATAYASPENALENAGLGHHFDVAILDQCMPIMPGNELAKRLNDLRPEYPIPSIILSSASDRSSNRMMPYITLQKPARNNDLIRALLRALKLGSHLPDPHAKHISVTTSKIRILVVEDNSVNQMVIIKMLAKLGYMNVTAVADGKEAVETCERMPIDIILMDIQMRIMDGYTATEKIRALANLAHQPWIIALTAGVQQADTERAFACGMNAFATKPIQLEQLYQVLTDAAAALGKIEY
jgi:signal transduction histidine kinase/DNA-binding response OmpR family regulator